ncbi:MAG: META domain-containing protein [Ilumatobacteraceae bacterium]
MTAPMPFEGVTWILSSVAGVDADVDSGLGDVEVTARFADGRVTGSSGCNRYSGTYALDGGLLTIGPNLIGTLMACGERQMAVERAFLRALPTVVTAEIDDSTLTLRTGGGAVLVFTAMAGDEAIAGTWTVTAVRTATAVASPVPGPTLTLRLADGRATGHAGCNDLMGTYTVDGEQLSIGPLATTRKLCTDPAVDRQERDYLAALAATRSFAPSRSRLTLLADDGTITVTLMRCG